MSYCINPNCQERNNSGEKDVCASCGTSLILNDRFRLTTPIVTGKPRENSQVFEALDLSQPEYKKVVKSVWRTSRIGGNKDIELLQRESRILPFLVHSGIPKADLENYFEVSTSEGQVIHCMVMDYVEGQNLVQWLSQNGPISNAKALDWLQQLASILHAFHPQGIFHRDLKPENVLLNPSGELVLIDFGAVREITDTYLNKLSMDPSEMGTASGEYEITRIYSHGYAPPEQINGRAIAQSDFFALGRTIIHLVTGIHPKYLPEDEDTGKLIWHDQAPQISGALAKYIDKLIERAPRKRPIDSNELIHDLTQIVPTRIKRERIFQSKVSRFLGLVSVIGLIFLGTLTIQRFWSSQLILAALKEQNRGDLIEAKEKYELSLQLNPSNYLTYNYLATLCVELKDLDCAISNYQQAIPHIPKNEKWVAYYNLGRVHDDLESYLMARKNYKEAIKLSQGKQLYPINNLVRLDLLSGNASGAKEQLLPLLSQTNDPEVQGGIYKNLGWAEFELGQYSQAQSYLQKATSIDPNRAGSFCLLAKTQEKLKKADPLVIQNCLLLDTELVEVISWKSDFLNILSNSTQ